MSKTHSHLTVSPRDSDEDVTFRATIYEDMGTAVSVMGPVDQIEIGPSKYDGDFKSDCGVSLNYRQTNEYHTHLGGLFVLKPDEERRLVEWLHDVGASFAIDTMERRNKSLEQAGRRGQCAGCDAYFKDGHDWSIHQRRGGELDLYFCDYDCLDESRQS